MAIMDQNRWPRSIGIAGQIPPDQVAKFIGIGIQKEVILFLVEN